MNRSAAGLRAALWAGFVFDWLLWLRAVFDPAGAANTFGQRVPLDPVWAAFSAQLVLLVSLFFIPAALDPIRYRSTAWLAALVRVPTAIFFLLLWPDDYAIIGIASLVIAAVQLPLLLALERSADLGVELGGTRRPSAPDRAVIIDDSTTYVPQRPPAPDRALIWFRRVMWLGIAQNVALGLPGIFWPETVLLIARQRPTDDPIWAAFASLTLIMLSLMYIPGAIDAFRYRITAILSVAARSAGVLFFFILYPGLYPLFGAIDLVFFILQAPLLRRVLNGASARDLPPAVDPGSNRPASGAP